MYTHMHVYQLKITFHAAGEIDLLTFISMTRVITIHAYARFFNLEIVQESQNSESMQEDVFKGLITVLGGKKNNKILKLK